MPERPIALLVDDDPTGLQLRAEAFSDANFSVIMSTHAEQAMRELWSSPMISLLYTDVNLAGKVGDTSGITLKDYVHDIRPDLPIVGYSGWFEDSEIPSHMVRGFLRWYPKGRQDLAHLDEMLGYLYEEALRYEGSRRRDAENRLLDLRQKYELDERHLQRYRALLPNQTYAVEQVLSELGYSAVLVPHQLSAEIFGTARPPVPLLFWSRQIDEIWEAELFGLPSIYATGATEDQAIGAAAELLSLFAEDVRQGGQYAGPAADLADLIRSLDQSSA